jgi:hypothetical protein
MAPPSSCEEVGSRSDRAFAVLAADQSDGVPHYYGLLFARRRGISLLVIMHRLQAVKMIGPPILSRGAARAFVAGHVWSYVLLRSYRSCLLDCASCDTITPRGVCQRVSKSSPGYLSKT